MNEHIQSHLTRGQRHFEAGHFQQAHAELSRALFELEEASLTLNEEALAELLVLRGTALASIDERDALEDPDVFNQVMDDYDTAIDLRPEELSYRNLRGRMYLHCLFADYQQKAREDFEYVLEKRPKDLDALRMLGMLAAEEGDHVKAVERFSQLLEEEEVAEVLAARGMSYLKLVPIQYEQAIQDFAKAIALNPEREDWYVWQAQALQECGELEAALHVYNDLIERAPKSPYLLERGNLLLELNPEQAFRDFQAAIKTGANPQAYNNLAWMLLQQGDMDAAIEHAQHALEVDPTCSIAYATLAEIYASIEDRERFYEYFTLALDHYYQDYMDAMVETAFQPFVQEVRFQELIQAKKQRAES